MGEDPVQPLTLTPNRSQNGPKRAINDCIEPGNVSSADDDSEVQTALPKF